MVSLLLWLRHYLATFHTADTDFVTIHPLLSASGEINHFLWNGCGEWGVWVIVTVI